MDLTDAQWALLEPLFRRKRRDDGRGRPWQDTRSVLNGVFWVLRPVAPWHDLPRRYPPYQTCLRRFQQWQRSGLLTRLLQKLAEGKLDLSESFIDASFQFGEKGLCCRTYSPRQRQQNHGDQRRPWPSSRRARGQRFTA